MSSISALCHFKCYTGIDSIGLLSKCNDAFLRELIKLSRYWCAGSPWDFGFCVGANGMIETVEAGCVCRGIYRPNKKLHHDSIGYCRILESLNLPSDSKARNFCSTISPFSDPPVMRQASAMPVQSVSQSFSNPHLLLLRHLAIMLTAEKVDNLNCIPTKQHKSVHSSISHFGRFSTAMQTVSLEIDGQIPLNDHRITVC